MAEAINVTKFKNDLQQTIDDLKDQYIKQLSIRSAAGIRFSVTCVLITVDHDHPIQWLFFFRCNRNFTRRVRG